MDTLADLQEHEAVFEAARNGESQTVIEALLAEDWSLQQAACVAAGRHPDAAYVPAILACLNHQDQLDLYGQQRDHGWAAGIPFAALNDELAAQSPQTLSTWMCRWRVKQAACLALGAIGEYGGADGMDPRVVDTLSRYAATEHDYQVRAAACAALGRIGDPGAHPALEQAADYEEWCTRVEARKALKALPAEG